MTHCYQLSINEREEISLGLAQGLSKNYIALSLGRSSSTICREVNRNTANRQAYRAVKAQYRANKLRYLPLLKEESKRYHLIILAYCLLSNHAHFIVVYQREGSIMILWKDLKDSLRDFLS